MINACLYAKQILVLNVDDFLTGDLYLRIGLKLTGDFQWVWENGEDSSIDTSGHWLSGFPTNDPNVNTAQMVKHEDYKLRNVVSPNPYAFFVLETDAII